MTEIQDLQDGSTTESNIQQFFRGANILVTGGSGFMGSVLIEKLLRSCPDIGQLFLLMRSKKDKSIEDRFQDCLTAPLFETLKRDHSESLSKVVLIAGDVGEENLGLSAADRLLLINKVNVIFHAAATVRFDEKLRLAVAVNITGTKYILELARCMTQLKALVHVSTAYANCPRKVIDEVFYPPGMTGEKLELLCSCLEDDQLQALQPVLLDKWPNTYAFTKASAEDTVRRLAGDLPIAIVRPSIVVNTAREPIKGWINNLYGPSGVTVGAGVGLLRSLHCNAKIVAEIVPVDLSINCIIAAAWDIAVQRDKKDMKSSTAVPSIPIYNYVSSVDNKVTWGEFMFYNERGLQWPPLNSLWYYCFTLNKHRSIHNLYIFFLHLIPALLVDGLLKISNKKPKLWNAYKKVHKFVDVIAYFCTQQWLFFNPNVNTLWSKLNVCDQRLFNFNIRDLNWEDALVHNIRGMRIYMLNDPLTTVEEAKKKYAKLKIAHYTTVVILGMILLYFVSRVLLYLFPLNSSDHL